MFGSFQSSQLRIEVNAPEAALRDALMQGSQLRQWLWPQTFSNNFPETLVSGTTFTSWLGPVEIQHHIDVAAANTLRLILSKGIDGFQEWSWGDNWVQSRLEGVSLLPLNVGQTLTLLRLKAFLEWQKPPG
ncbi:MAG: hypothetical protein HC851_13330 [Acaryochloris sp. RU_4_1]|nr:hypothetical protein [Acaryochloris sp. RU_4_1]